MLGKIYFRFVFLILGLGLGAALGVVELDCDVTELVGDYTVTQDLICSNHSVTITNTTGSGVVIDVVNIASIEGLRFLVDGGVTLTFTGNNVTLSGCDSGLEKGGALYVDTGGKVVFESPVSFISNFAEEDGGAVYVAGEVTFEAAVIFDGNIAAGPYIATTSTSNEISTSNGGALYIMEGGKALFRSPVTFANNIAENGGSVYVDGEVTFEAAAKFDNNTSSTAGGALCIEFGATATFKSTAEFFANSAVRLSEDSSESTGGALYIGGTATFKSTVEFSANRADSGGGYFLAGR